jgi:hypothetical protein
MRSATPYMRSRQRPEVVSCASRRSARPAKARWKAWLCASTSGGSTGPSSTVRGLRPRLSGRDGRCQCPSGVRLSSTPGCQRPSTQACGAHQRGSTSGLQSTSASTMARSTAAEPLARATVPRANGGCFVHVGAPAHLELQGVHAPAGRAVVARDVAALEAAVEHMAELASAANTASACALRPGAQLRPPARAQVQVRQRAFEQPGQLALDAVPVEQHRMAVRGPQARQLGGQRVVVGLPVGLAPRAAPRRRRAPRLRGRAGRR